MVRICHYLWGRPLRSLSTVERISTESIWKLVGTPIKSKMRNIISNECDNNMHYLCQNMFRCFLGKIMNILCLCTNYIYVVLQLQFVKNYSNIQDEVCYNYDTIPCKNTWMFRQSGYFILVLLIRWSFKLANR